MVMVVVVVLIARVALVMAMVVGQAGGMAIGGEIECCEY